jgi:hypothetical protein
MVVIFGLMAQQLREAPDAKIQKCLISMQQAAKQLDPQGAVWLKKHATPDDLRDLATKIEAVANTAATK